MRSTEIETRYGRLRLAATQADHIHADANSNVLGDSEVGFTINGVRYGISAHVYRWADGAWHIGREDATSYERACSLHGSRADWSVSYAKSLMSQSARRKAFEEIERAVNEWAATADDTLAEAQAEYVERERATRQAKIAGLLEEIATLERELEALAER